MIEDGVADDDGDDDAGEVRSEAGEDGVAGAADPDGAEVNGEDVEGGLRAAHDGAGGAGDEAIGAACFDEVCEEAECAAAAEGADEDDGEEVDWEADAIEQWAKRAGNQIDAAGGAEHADGDEYGDEVWDDADGDVEAIAGALDELLIYLDATGEGVDWENGEEEWNGEDGDGGDGAEKRGGAGDAE